MLPSETAHPGCHAPEPTALARGAVLAPGYGVLEHLRRGNTLDIYDVWSDERQCRCIAKALRPSKAADKGAARRLRFEGKLLLQLSHPHIVRAYELITRPRPLLILETLTGVTLAKLLDGGQRMTLRDVYYLGLHLGSAIHYVHRQGFLHLDLKPSNIIAEWPRAKVIDFDIARRPGRGHPGEGTPAYMAPEQLRGADLTAATDVWGIGAVLFEATTSQPPFSDDLTRTAEQVGPRAAPLLSQRRVPKRFANLVDSCLDPDPLQRPAVLDVTAVLNGLV